ncbi:MAG: hypothetical protein FD143_2383 [Ignavibacteria bacterium]|nr:MAG: hypothetical protein FD143_2383 [Ignavibacteria bacterium]KAF0157609.1 MAG: hypothetical protein FD188_2708 [Ignavibacteria bacterium]
MKKLTSLLLVFVLLTTACSTEPPSVRVQNLRTNKANVQIKLANSNTININDVSAGATSSYREVVSGTAMATAVIQNEKDSPSILFTANDDKNYTVVIQTGTTPTLKVDVTDK